MNAQCSVVMPRGIGRLRQVLSILSGNGLLSIQSHSQFTLARAIHANRCSSKTLSHLTSRAVVRLSGSDTLGFLQGLVTNDVHRLATEISTQYNMMLNVQGRVLYDLFLYNIGQDAANPILLVDVDKSAKDDLIKILKRYKLRKKVDISDVSDEFQVWSKFRLSTNTSVTEPRTSVSKDVVVVSLDPRVSSFGTRIIRRGQDEEWNLNSVDESVYRQMRFQWGIPEGISDLPPGNCFPLESNLVFMNGVDFQKGCYIGQELTARTHHTGVTRKRIMPLVINNPQLSTVRDVTIVNDKGKNVGKLRSHEKGFGLGLLRLAYIEDQLSLKIKDETTQVKTEVPLWWPTVDSQF